jgi:hypothetical protein
VVDLTKEFSQLHLRDQYLDDFIKQENRIQETHNRFFGGRGEPQELILPGQIELVIERLRALAEQIK